MSSRMRSSSASVLRNEDGEIHSFAKLCAVGVAAVALGYGGVQGVQALRANSYEKDLVAAQHRYAGASAVQSREMSVLADRERQAADAIVAVRERDEMLGVLLGMSADAVVQGIQGDALQGKQAIERAVSIEAGIPPLLAQKKHETNSEFIRASKTFAQHEQIDFDQEPSGVFAGPSGFASTPLQESVNQAVNAVEKADLRYAALRSELLRDAQTFDDTQASATQRALLDEAKTKLQAQANAQATGQIEGYRNQVKAAADAAFRHEGGESMSQSDWDDINEDLEQDPGWQSAKLGLQQSANSTAQEALGILSDSLSDEREQAQNLAAAVKTDPDGINAMSIWEMALLMQWMNPSWARANIAQTPFDLGNAGYSLTGRYNDQWGDQGAWRNTQDDTYTARHANSWRWVSGRSTTYRMPPSPYRPGQARTTASSSMSRSAAPTAGWGSGSPTGNASVATPSASTQSMAQAMSQAMPMGQPAGIKAGTNGASSYVATPSKGTGVLMQGAAARAGAVDYSALGKMSQLSTLTARASANATRQIASEEAAKVSAKTASSAAQRASDNAAQQASQRVALVAALSAQNASRQAALRASQEAATRASSLAASQAAQKAASTAASRAAQTAAQSAASQAANKAASDAAQKAASSAAQKAASSAAQKAASSAAEKAASRAAQAAASRAAQSAANRAAQSAAQKASASASSKAAQSASARSSSSSRR